MQRAAEDLAERLATVERQFAKAAALFCVTGCCKRRVARAPARWRRCTRIEADATFLGGPRAGRCPTNDVPLDAGKHRSRRLAAVAAGDERHSRHADPDPPRADARTGCFSAALPGAGTLAELRESLLAAETELTGGASPRVVPFADVRDAGALLQRAGFALPVADVETVTVRYATMFDLMADLRAMGATNALSARSRRPATRTLFERAAEIYAERFSDADGRIRATFSMVWLSGWAPDASQQKPLKPGSAQVSLTTGAGRK